MCFLKTLTLFSSQGAREKSTHAHSLAKIISDLATNKRKSMMSTLAAAATATADEHNKQHALGRYARDRCTPFHSLLTHTSTAVRLQYT